MQTTPRRSIGPTCVFIGTDIQRILKSSPTAMGRGSSRLRQADRSVAFVATSAPVWKTHAGWPSACWCSLTEWSGRRCPRFRSSPALMRPRPFSTPLMNVQRDWILRSLFGHAPIPCRTKSLKIQILDRFLRCRVGFRIAGISWGSSGKTD